HQLRVGLRLAHLDDVQEHFVGSQALDLFLELLDAGAALADDDAGARCVDVDLGLVGGALDVDVGDAGVRQLILDELLELQVLMEPLGIVLLFVPPRGPGLDDAQPKSSRMRFLTHGSYSSLSSPTTTVRWLVRWLIRLARPMARGI